MKYLRHLNLAAPVRIFANGRLFLLALGLLVLVALQAGFYSTPTALASEPDNRGTEFVLGFNTNVSDGGFFSTELFVGADAATTVTVSIPGIGFGPTPFPVVPGAITTIDLPPSSRMVGSGSIEDKGILVTAPEEIVVYGLNPEGATTDGYLGLPVDVQGTDYLIPSYFNRVGGAPSEFGVVGIQDNTTVTITPSFAAQPGANTPGTLPAGTPFSITLNRLQTFQLKDAGIPPASIADLTGSVITSDKPISVFGAHADANVPVGVFLADHLVEQIPPTSTWGTEFLTVPLATRTGGDVFRILASQAGTNVKLNGAPLGGTINRGQFIETDIPSTTFARITSDKPVLVVQYSKGATSDGNQTSDPFMMMIPPIGQFASEYIFSTPASNPETFTNFVNIVAPSAQLAGIRLDGAAVSSAWTAIGTSGYSGTQVPVAIGTHTVSHTSPIVAFGIYVYGFAGLDAYGYPGGMRLATIANQPGSITICKQTDPSGGTGFGFGGSTPSFVLEPFVLADNECSTIPVPSLGTYSVTEAPPAGWQLTNIVCVGGSSIGFFASPGGFSIPSFIQGDIGVAINLAAGENVTCYFTNSAMPCATTSGLDISTGTAGVPGDVDPKWHMIAGPPNGNTIALPPFPAYVVSTYGANFSGFWVHPPVGPFGGVTQWITYTSSSTGNPSGQFPSPPLPDTYTYDTAFCVKLNDCPNPQLALQFASADETLVQLNGITQALGQPGSAPPSYQALYPAVPATITTDFVNGMNHLTFTVNFHSDYPTGLLVKGKVTTDCPPIGGTVALSVSGSGSPVPWAPLAAGAAAVMAVLAVGGWYVRRRWLR